MFGLHNPVVHTIGVTMSWFKLFGVPSIKEFICILFHDIGYIQQNVIDGEGDNHMLLGAKLCGKLFGEEYYDLCVFHSRDYASKLNRRISMLGYADKYWLFLLPGLLFQILITFGGEKTIYHKSDENKWGRPISVELIRVDYLNWFRANFNGVIKSEINKR